MNNYIMAGRKVHVKNKIFFRLEQHLMNQQDKRIRLKNENK